MTGGSSTKSATPAKEAGPLVTAITNSVADGEADPDSLNAAAKAAASMVTIVADQDPQKLTATAATAGQCGVDGATLAAQVGSAAVAAGSAGVAAGATAGGAGAVAGGGVGALTGGAAAAPAAVAGAVGPAMAAGIPAAVAAGGPALISAAPTAVSTANSCSTAAGNGLLVAADMVEAYEATEELPQISDAVALLDKNTEVGKKVWDSLPPELQNPATEALMSASSTALTLVDNVDVPALMRQVGQPLANGGLGGLTQAGMGGLGAVTQGMTSAGMTTLATPEAQSGVEDMLKMVGATTSAGSNDNQNSNREKSTSTESNSGGNSEKAEQKGITIGPGGSNLTDDSSSSSSSTSSSSSSTSGEGADSSGN